MNILDDRRVAAAPFPRWVERGESESDAPEHRIIHGVSWDASGDLFEVRRVGIRAAEGYYYCGSMVDHLYDWVRDFEAFALIEGEWMPVLQQRAIAEPDGDDVTWFELEHPVQTTAFVMHVRRGGIAGWWTPWNLAKTGVVLEGELLASAPIEADAPSIVTAPTAEAVTWTTGALTTTFSLRRPSLTDLRFDSLAATPNLLRQGSLEFIFHDHVTQFANGAAMRAVGRPQLIGGLRRDQAALTIETDDESVTYTSSAPGMTVTNRWSKLADGIRLQSTLELADDTLFWNADVWSFCFDPRVAATVVYGESIEEGYAGVTRLPAEFDLPGFGELRLSSDSGELRLYNEVVRSAYATNHAVQLAARDDEVAGVRIAAGTHSGTFDLTVAPRRELRAASERAIAPAVISMLQLAVSSALPYRQDTATLTNNGSSQQAYVCLDTWAMLVEQLDQLLPGRDAYGMLRRSLERWLDFAPGYASGTVEMEQSYLMTRTSGLSSVAAYLLGTGDVEWYRARAEQIWAAVEFTRKLDSDGDGLIESPVRLGIRGEGQWSSNWWDGISFGHKDAFSNAQLYPALLRLAEWYVSQGEQKRADSLIAWAVTLKASFTPAFLNPDTGWFGGWRSPDGELHDYAFLFVNGAAIVGGLVEPDRAADIVNRLVAELDRVGFTHFEFGLPGNLRSVDDDDMPELLRNLPFETYLNGSATLSQARWFLEALYAVGRVSDADAMLEKFASAFVNSTAIAGVEAGTDWRRWDGSPSGYEGILCDQFGIFGVAVREFGVTRADLLQAVQTG